MKSTTTNSRSALAEVADENVLAVDTNVSTALLSHIAQFREGNWAPLVRERTELCLLEVLTCYSAGLTLGHFAPSAAVANALFGFSPSSCASRRRPSTFAMAYLFGQAADSLDYDDTLLLGHPGAPIIAPMVAVAAREGLSTDRLLRGIASAYEVDMILSGSAEPSPERAALVRSVGVWDTVAAGIGVGVALGLDDQMLTRILGLAVAHSMLPYTAKWYERPVPALKNNAGWVAAAAVLSVDLALTGQTGVSNALEGKRGMWRMVGSDRWKLDRTLFEKPAVVRAGFKRFPACWHLQENLKALAELLATLEPDDEIVEVEVSGPADLDKFCQREIFGPADVAFSLPVTFSLLISGVEPGPEWTKLSSRPEFLRYVPAFRYRPSENRVIALRTRSGSERNVAVGVSDPLDRFATGLDKAGVIAKCERLCDPVLRNAVNQALAVSSSSSEVAVPYQLYERLEELMLV